LTLKRLKKNMSLFFTKFFKKRNKRISQNKVKGRKTSPRKKVYLKSRKIVKRKQSVFFSASIYSSIIIFIGFISLSFTIFSLSRQIQPVIRNERLRFLCTYQLDDKKNKYYKDAKLKLEKLVGDSEKYCKNFLKIKEKNNKRFRFFPILNKILLRFI
tara:strand:+ start:101 stop:571 length:471 start_codon:yes stop_codon:yes gene_type:complete